MTLNNALEEYVMGLLKKLYDINGNDSHVRKKLKASRDTHGKDAMRYWSIRKAFNAIMNYHYLKNDNVANRLQGACFFVDRNKSTWEFQNSDVLLQMMSKNGSGHDYLSRVSFLEHFNDPISKEKWRVLKTRPLSSQPQHSNFVSFTHNTSRYLFEFDFLNNDEWNFIEFLIPAFTNDQKQTLTLIPIEDEDVKNVNISNTLQIKWDWQKKYYVPCENWNDYTHVKYLRIDNNNEIYYNLERQVYSLNLTVGAMDRIKQISQNEGYSEALKSHSFQYLTKNYRVKIIPFEDLGVPTTKNIQLNRTYIEQNSEKLKLTKIKQRQLVQLANHFYMKDVKEKESHRDLYGDLMYGKAEKSEINWVKILTVLTNHTHGLEKLLKTFSWNQFMVISHNKEGVHNIIHEIHAVEIFIQFLQQHVQKNFVSELCTNIIERLNDTFDGNPPQLLLKICELYGNKKRKAICNSKANSNEFKKQKINICEESDVETNEVILL